MSEDKVFIFFNNSHVGIDRRLFLDWIKTNGFIPIATDGMSDNKLRRRWNRLVQSFHLGFQLNYPISDSFDLEILKSFIGHVQNNPGQWYYVPRPNDYVWVQEAALMGMNPMIPIERTSDFVRNIGFHVLSSPWLPRSLRITLKKLGVSIWKTLYKDKPDGSVHYGQLQVVIPPDIQRWPANWKLWRPSLAVLKHDLLDRVECFFAHPKSIHVVLLNKCNLKCIMCPYYSTKYTSYHTSGYFSNLKLMSENVFQKIAEYAGKSGINLQFGQIEEPLMHKRIFDFFELAKKAGVPNIHMTTNGTLLDRDKADRLSRTGINSVMFSLDAATPEIYQKIRGTNLVEVEKNIKYFLSLAKKKGIQVMVSFIMQAEAHNEREQFLEKWRHFGVDSVTYYVLANHDPVTGSIIPGKQLYDKGKRYPCASPWVQSVVFPEGEVSLCCKTMSIVGWKGIVSVGNLHEQSFDEIWSGARYRTVRSELLKNKFKEFDICGDCEIWSATSYLSEENPSYVRTYNETMETINFV
ncbi:MAG: radical SAM/SPASM domain-containing protein [Promethearchaeota archaeon]